MSTDQMRANFNTIMLAACLGVMSWVGYTTHETSKQLASIGSNINAKTEKDAEHDRDIIELRARVTRLEIEMAEYRARQTPIR